MSGIEVDSGLREGVDPLLESTTGVRNHTEKECYGTRVSDHVCVVTKNSGRPVILARQVLLPEEEENGFGTHD